MTIVPWKKWGITARLCFITVLPVLLMFCSVLSYSTYSRIAEVEEELAERGNVLASALAQSSEYGIVSGNFPHIERTIESLLQHDKSIARVEIWDAGKRTLLDIAGAGSSLDDHRHVFMAPIQKELAAIDSFAEEGMPHVSSSSVGIVSVTAIKEALGYVRIEMSPSRMIAKQRQRIIVGSAIASVALLVSAILGLCLALGLTRPLARTIVAVRQIRGGNYDVQLVASAGCEIGDLQSSIVDMAANLNQFKQDLEGKVIARTRELQTARDEAVKAHGENRRLIQKVNSVVEDERKSIAIELHDQFNASLIVARLELQRILDLAMQSPASMAGEEIRVKAQSIISLTSDLYALCRSIVRRLRPEVLDMLGLRNAVEDMINHYAEIHPGCRFKFHACGDFSGLEDSLSMTAYRLVQEGLSNVVKHSGATEASVHIGVTEDGKILHIRIADNGKGFDPQTIEPGIGLIGMRERICGMEGRLKMHSEHNAGTEIFIELPVHANAKN